MQIDTSQVLDLLRSQGRQDTASQADDQLPQQVDPERDSGLLESLGIDPKVLLATFLQGQGGALGAVGGLLGGSGGHDGSGTGKGGGLGGLLGR